MRDLSEQGLTEIGKPKKGETVVVSGAAGATGSVVVQIACVPPPCSVSEQPSLTPTELYRSLILQCADGLQSDRHCWVGRQVSMA